MNSLEAALRQELEQIKAAGLYRQLRRLDSPQDTKVEIAARTLLNFSSNDYLGLANDPRVKAGAIAAVQKYGAGSGASRLICGSLACHHKLEEALASFKRAESAVVFSTGFAAALGTICSVVGRDDILIIDKLVHACVVDAARASGATLRVFDHNNLEDLEDILKWARARGLKNTNTRPRRVLIVTESVFSMDGDLAPLREIVDLKERYGAWLMVDEAHSTGLHGTSGRGLADQLGVSRDIEIQMGTLGKALGSAGGFICGSHALAELVINRARTFIFSTAPVPAASGAAMAALDCVVSPDGDSRRARLWASISRVHSALPGCGASRQPHESAILPVMIGDERKALQAAASLQETGIFVPAVRFPTVPRNEARLRVTITAAHTDAEIEQLASALRAAGLADAAAGPTP